LNDEREPSHRPLTRERWEKLAPLVDAVLDLPPEKRTAYIAEISAGDRALAAELSRFAVASEGTADRILEQGERERSALLGNRLFDYNVNLFAELQTSLGATYRIEREMAGGGMSRLFVAEERELQRKVVIKVLPPEVAGVAAERFTREIKLAASLQQANIVPVLAAGTVAGFPYYTMPFIEGRSLRDRLARDDAPSISEAIGTLRDVARALAYAHDRGIVHRDIKPGNILLSDRTAVVMDFGIARAVAAVENVAESRSGETANVVVDPLNLGGVRHDSLVIGTPAYMAPEQAVGDADVDHRADIYAFGCVAYELFTGTRAFVGASTSDIIAAHLRGTPLPVTTLRPEVPAAVADLVAACLAKDPARRPQSAEHILTALDKTLHGAESSPSNRHRGVVLTVFSVALVAALTFGWFFRNSHARPGAERGTTNAAALDAYRIGREQMRRRAVDQSMRSFRRAIVIDSNFAGAHAALALALELGPFYDGTPADGILTAAVAESRRAIALDSTLDEAWVALGNARGLGAAWSASDSAMRRAIALDGNNATVRQAFARQLIMRGAIDKGFEQLERARTLDPTSPLISAWLSYAFFLKGMPDSALAQSERTVQLDSTLLAATNLGSLVNLALGRTDVARQLLTAPVTREMTNATYVYARLGDTATANRLVRDMELRSPRPWFIDVSRASVFLAMGDTGNALTALERSADTSGPLWVFYMSLSDPAFDPIRRSSRFAALLRRANISSDEIEHARRAPPGQ
jgi:serine/threonine protein kinase/tetratricopeptide (TPR) repeat protein